MKDHLTECRLWRKHFRVTPTACICHYIELCEYRVREEWYESQSETWEQGFFYAIDNIIEHVKELPWSSDTMVAYNERVAIIGAIRNMRDSDA